MKSNIFIFHGTAGYPGEKLAEYLDVSLTFIPNAGHFNEKAGYLTFPDLLKKVENIL